MSNEQQRQKSIKATCFHPTGKWVEFAQEEIEQSVVSRFEQIVAHHADHIAVVAEGAQLTYAELNQAANRLAHRLLQQRGSTAEPIAIYAGHSAAAVIAIFGIIKAGKFYVALDPNYPDERLTTILAHSQATVILIDPQNSAKAKQIFHEFTTLVIGEEGQTNSLTTNPGLDLGADDAICIGYTSGSTGQPKGFLYPHRLFLQSYLRIYANTFRVCPEDRITWLHTLSFSSSWAEIMLCLLNGATLFAWEIHKYGFEELPSWFAEHKITIANFTTTPFRQFLAALPTDLELPHLRLVLLGGETILKQDIANYQRTIAKHTVIAHRFGSSETGCSRLFFVNHETTLVGSSLPAGYEVEGKTILLLNENGDEVPTGEIGEIVVRSRYLVTGYWRDPDSTRQKFVKNESEIGEVTFLSSDLGRFQEDGCLEFVGRKDFLVKIRGQRVEIAEVENCLNNIEGIHGAVVHIRANAQGEQLLVAYFVPSRHFTPSADDIRSILARKLPFYMIPSHYVAVDRFPLTNSNKVDRLALAAIEISTPSIPYVAPRTEVEKWLSEIWQEVLKIDEIGVHDHFLDLGGDSLKGMQIIARIRAALDDYLYFSSLLNAPTIAQFAEYLSEQYTNPLAKHFVGVFELSKNEKPQPSFQPLNPSDVETMQKLLPSFRSAPQTLNIRQPKNPPAIFVLAPGRSGTTLLRVMLGGHPQLFAPPELALLRFNTLRQRRDICLNEYSFWLEGTLQALMTIHSCTLEQAQKMMEGYELEGLSTQAFYRKLQDWVVPRILVDKTPNYAHNQETLQWAEQEFDCPFYIHLTRHPLATIRSFVTTHMEQLLLLSGSTHFTPHQQAELIWSISHRNILEFLKKIPAERQFCLKFEEMVKFPHKKMEEVCHFLHLNFHEEMIQPYTDNNARMTNSIHPLSAMAGDPKFHQHRTIDAAIADRWRNDPDVHPLSDLTWQIAEQLGYTNEDELPVSRTTIHQLLDEIEALSDQQMLDI